MDFLESRRGIFWNQGNVPEKTEIQTNSEKLRHKLKKFSAQLEFQKSERDRF